jgi:hypothetical protein
VPRLLLHVRVERVPLINHIVETGRRSRGDERRHTLQTTSESADPVVHGRPVLRRRPPHEVRAVGRVPGGGREEVERRIRRGPFLAQRRQRLLLGVRSVARKVFGSLTTLGRDSFHGNDADQPARRQGEWLLMGRYGIRLRTGPSHRRRDCRL